MTTPAFDNPILGVLHPVTWNRPAGNTDMKITQDAASHAAQIDPISGRHRPKALDIGDGAADLDTLVAAHACVVAEARTDGSANLALEFMLRGVLWRMIYAHDTLPHPVKVGQVLAEGDVVGRMGKTSSPSMPVAIHLHWQVGYWDGTQWIWVDPEPLLKQNGAIEDNDMIPISGANYKRLGNKKSTLKFNGNFRDERKSGEVLQLFPAGTVIYPTVYANDGDVPTGSQSGEWFACVLYVKNRGNIFGWFHSSLVNPLEDEVATGGFTQKDVNDAKAAGRADGIQAAKDDLADLK